MKKMLLVLVCLGLGLVPTTALARSVTSVTIMDGATAISASDDYSSATLTTFTVGDREGFFAIQAVTTGNGTGKIEFYTSIDGVTFKEPTGGGDIITGLTTAGGAKYAEFSPDYCEKIRIVVTETGGANSITPTIKMIYR